MIHPTALGYIGGGDRERNLPSSSMELCLGSCGLVNCLYCYLGRLFWPTGWLTMTQEGALCQGLVLSNLQYHRGSLLEQDGTSDYKSQKHLFVCDAYCWRNGIKMAWKGPDATLARGEANSIYLELCPKCLSNIWVQHQITLANSPCQNIKTYFNRHL